MSSTDQTRTARLALADGTLFVGRAFGAADVLTQAEVVFNTAMTGYQEALTDPSYAGQILVMTAPLIGNYGVNETDIESGRVHVAGFVVRELARLHSNFRATGDLASYLADQGVLGLTGVDTRAVTRRIRTAGAMPGVITDKRDVPDDELVRIARQAPSMAGRNLVPGVGCTTEHGWDRSLGDWTPDGLTLQAEAPSPTTRPLTVLALDCGAKRNILRHLSSRGWTVRVIPHDTPAGEIRQLHETGQAHGLFVSNGPGDPAAVSRVIDTLRELVGVDVADPIPTFGICLGHQLLALALGATTYKLKFGHRGSNQPVLNTITGRVEITSQNHGFAVDADSLTAIGAEVTHVNLNDATVAGFRLPGRPLFAVQHHPEASPGPHDAGPLFDAFFRMMIDQRPVEYANS